LDILIVIDTSKSMLTTDVKPNRLERTKLAVKDLVKKLNGDRIGLLAFAGDAFLICPLTVDYGGFLMSLDDINVGTIPRGGTAIGKALENAIKGFDNTPSQYKAIIVLTDGENLEGDPIHWAKEAKQKGIKVFCVGIGTQDGELIQIENDKGEKEFLKDSSGNFVKSRLDESLLQQIALETGGAYVQASGIERMREY
jgi:Ca-activated chloride channel family protein